MMSSGFASAPHPGLRDWDERAFRPSRGNGAALSRFVMLSTRLPEGETAYNSDYCIKERKRVVCVHGGGEWKLPCTGCDLLSRGVE